MKAIGPSFYDELVAADVAGLPFSWSGDGEICFDPSMTAAQISAVEAVYAAHDPTTLSMEQKVAQQASLMGVANAKTVGMSDSFILGTLSADDTTKFKTWAAYKLALSQVDLTQSLPTWPEIPQT